jgi:hypothetical protein
MTLDEFDASLFEIREALRKSEDIIAGIDTDDPGTRKCDQCGPEQKLARVGLFVGRMIAVAARLKAPDTEPEPPTTASPAPASPSTGSTSHPGT